MLSWAHIGLAGSFGWSMIEARGLYLARRLFTLSPSSSLSHIITIIISIIIIVCTFHHLASSGPEQIGNWETENRALTFTSSFQSINQVINNISQCQRSMCCFESTHMHRNSRLPKHIKAVWCDLKFDRRQFVTHISQYLWLPIYCLTALHPGEQNILQRHWELGNNSM